MATTAQPRTSSATPEDWRALSDVLAAAFADDPVWSWLLPDGATRLERLRRFFGLETRAVVLRHGASVAARDETGALGAALVLPPGRWRTPLRVQALHAPGFTRVFGRRVPIALGVLTSMERRHIRERHVYLPYIGVGPAAQGQGIGSAMLGPVLERCDREGLPAYLEASSPRSAALYARLGFRTLDLIRPFGSPPLELMRRPPGSLFG